MQVSLIVFDECHHTRKNHAYNGIMREYFQESPEKRPKVFGMTASPIWNPRDAVESLATLERNLDAKVIAVREHVAELADHSPRPREVSIANVCETRYSVLYADHRRIRTFPTSIPGVSVYGLVGQVGPLRPTASYRHTSRQAEDKIRRYVP